jgi:hypothetical protein
MKPKPNPKKSSLWGTTRNAFLFFVLLILPAGGTIGYLLWELHTPKTEIRTPVVINRNSLLPHRFAGVCENCHRVRDVGPVEMNLANMNLFNLRLDQRRLLVAGQRVEAPSFLQRLRVPAIKRTESLAHPYVGVCSNCHVILDVSPSASMAQRAMSRAYQPLVMGAMSQERIARGGRREGGREFWRNLFGFTALGLALVACVYIVMRYLMNKYPAVLKGKLKIKPWFTAHEWCSSAFTVATILHWYFSDRGNNFLHIALLIVIWLTMAGYVLRYRMAEKTVQKNVKLLHSQRGLFVALVVLLVVGHVFAEFY